MGTHHAYRKYKSPYKVSPFLLQPKGTHRTLIPLLEKEVVLGDALNGMLLFDFPFTSILLMLLSSSCVDSAAAPPQMEEQRFKLQSRAVLQCEYEGEDQALTGPEIDRIMKSI